MSEKSLRRVKMRVDGMAAVIFAISVSLSFVAVAREKRVNFSCDHVPDAEYRAFAELGKSLGATHVSAPVRTALALS